MCRQMDSMAASASAQQAAHAEAEERLTERLKTVEAALSEIRGSEHSLRVGLHFLDDPLSKPIILSLCCWHEDNRCI